MDLNKRRISKNLIIRNVDAPGITELELIGEVVMELEDANADILNKNVRVFAEGWEELMGSFEIRSSLLLLFAL